MQLETKTIQSRSLRRTSRLLCLGIALATASLLDGQPPALPQPAVVFYGAVSLATDGRQVAPETVGWDLAGNGESVTASNTTVVTIDGTTFYLTRIPFETRHVDGLPDFPASPDSLELTRADTTYTRRATVTVDGTARPAALPAGMASFLHGAARLGLVERIDLVVGETYDEWSQRIFGEVVDREADADGDGRSNRDEFLQGTDPRSAASLSILREFTATPAGGFTIRWDSRAGRSYLVEWSDKLGGGDWHPVGAAFAGTGAVLSYTHPDGAGTRLFFRITVSELAP